VDGLETDEIWRVRAFTFGHGTQAVRCEHEPAGVPSKPEREIRYFGRRRYGARRPSLPGQHGAHLPSK
jgi:hypothetical protein